MNFRNKLECFVPGEFYPPGLSNTNFLQKFVNYGQKIITLGPGVNVIKLFFFIADEEANTSKKVCSCE